jgi:TRAP-type C4-dicarboxylate transport system substrate-binding protein
MQAVKKNTTMLTTLVRCAVIAVILFPAAVVGDPIPLKLAYITSDQTRFYQVVIKPFVDAVNRDEEGGIIIETYPSGVLGKDPGHQSNLALDGIADIAFVPLGAAANRFKDHAVAELPGLFLDLPEATQVNGRLVASGILEGYDDFFVIGAFATEPESIHARVPVASLDDLRGKKIRANNPIEASALARLGMSAVVLPIGKTSEAITRGTIDGAATAMVPLTDFGLGRITTYHYYLRLGTSVLSILMNRKKFESLPKPGRDVIRRYSGEWLAERFVKGFELYNTEFLEQLKSDPLRTVTFPSQSEIDVAERTFRALRAEWADATPRHRQLLNAVEAELVKFRSEHSNHQEP